MLAMAFTLPITEAQLPLHRDADPPRSLRRVAPRRPSPAHRRRVQATSATRRVRHRQRGTVGFAGVSIAIAATVASARSSATVKQVAPSTRHRSSAPTPLRRSDRRPRSLVSVAPSVSAAPGQTVPTTPPPTAPPTTVLQDVPYFAVGESVMLGAKPVLDARGIKTVAEVSKGPTWELEQLRLAKTTVPLHSRRRHPTRHQRHGDPSRSTKTCSPRLPTSRVWW